MLKSHVPRATRGGNWHRSSSLGLTRLPWRHRARSLGHSSWDSDLADLSLKGCNTTRTGRKLQEQQSGWGNWKANPC